MPGLKTLAQFDMLGTIVWTIFGVNSYIHYLHIFEHRSPLFGEKPPLITDADVELDNRIRSGLEAPTPSDPTARIAKLEGEIESLKKAMRDNGISTLK